MTVSGATAVDLFAGAGGATQGLIEAGIEVLGAVEFDTDAAASYRSNHPNVKLWESDIREVSAASLARGLGLKKGELTLLKACPPCQGFSTLAGGRSPAADPRNDLVMDTIRFVRALRPQIFLVENVPGLQRDPRSGMLLAALRELGYVARIYRVDAAAFGVPQRRKRVIVLAVRGRRNVLPERLEPGEGAQTATVRQAFAALAVAVSDDDRLNIPRASSNEVARRIAAVPIGGSRLDLPVELQLECHKRLDKGGKSQAIGSYGRLRLDEVSPTMTTRCTTPACGSFIHPTLNRAITLREAACLQTFPPDYKFSGGATAIERQIGNAVPVAMASAIAKRVLDLIE